MDTVRTDHRLFEAIDVLVPENDDQVFCPMDENELTTTLAKCTGVQQVESLCTTFIRQQQEQMDERITDFVQEQQDRFEQVFDWTRSKRDFVLRVLQERSSSGNIADSIQEDCIPQERRRSGGEDSAVPLSPVSLRSTGDPSPVVQQQQQQQLQKQQFFRDQEDDTKFHPRSSLMSSIETDDDMTVHKLNDHDDEQRLFYLDEDRQDILIRPSTIDDGETDDSGTGDDYYCTSTLGPNDRRPTQTTTVVTRTPGAGVLGFGTSLPVTIPGRFWPPKDAKDSLPEGGDCSSDNDDDDQSVRQNTVFPVKLQSHDLFRNMRAQARSIQAADDPERLFGERPQRRRYRTGNTVRQRMVRKLPQTQTTASDGTAESATATTGDGGGGGNQLMVVANRC